MKTEKTQRLAIRKPVQARARHKIGLILEAAMRLLDQGGMEALTTNAVAELAGVSIGTLYQYFPNKDAILGRLADQEMEALSARVLLALQDAAPMTPQARIGRIVSAVAASFGQRRRVHRLVVEYTLARGGQRILPLVHQITALLTTRGLPTAEQAMSAADAFVLTNAFTGVMRAMMTRPDDTNPGQSEIEDALSRLIIGFFQPAQPA